LSGHAFENHARRYLRRRYKATDGWQIELHPHYKYHPAAYVRVPDFVITRTRYGKEAVIAEAKYVHELTVGHLEQLLDYYKVFGKIRRGFAIQEIIMLIGPRDHTYVSPEVYEYAEYSDIEITRLPVYF
jgi:hypothetical protein